MDHPQRSDECRVHVASASSGSIVMIISLSKKLEWEISAKVETRLQRELTARFQKITIPVE